MATTLQDCSEVEKILGYGLDPDPIIISKGGSFAAANYTKIDGCFKDCFTSANLDYWSLQSGITWQDTTEIDLEFELESNFSTANEAIWSKGLTSGTGTGVSLRYRTSTVIWLAIIHSGGSHIVTVNVPLGTNIITVIGSEVFADAVKVADVPFFTFNFLGTEAEYVGRRSTSSSWYFNGCFIRVKVGSEVYLPTSSGVTFEGSEGTVVTRTTSSPDPVDYINNVMIQQCYV